MVQKILKKIDELKALIETQGIHQKEFLTLREAAIYLQLSKSCLYKMKDKEGLVYFKPGGKNIYFKKSNLDNWVLKGKIDSEFETENEIQNYLTRTNINL